MGNTFGQLFRITTWGESHGGGVGVVVDGCPPRLPLTEADIQPDLDRRRPGQSSIVTPRKETDTVKILSGTFEGLTLGTPISMWVKNEDFRSEAYNEMAEKFRPSHADTPTTSNTVIVPGPVADALPPAKRLAVWPPAPSQRNSCANSGASKCWPA